MSKLSTTTVLMEIVPGDGVAVWRDAWAGPGYRSFQATPPSTFGSWLDGSVPVRIRHDGPTVGHLDYCEHSMGHGDGAMFGIAVIEGVGADLIDGKVMCSAEVTANALASMVNTTEWARFGMRSSTKTVGEMNATESKLDGVALVDSTASVTSTRCRAWNGDYRDPVDRGRWQQRNIPAIIDRAIAAVAPSLRYRRPPAIPIHHPDRYVEGVEGGEYRNGGRPEIVHHAAGYVLGVY